MTRLIKRLGIVALIVASGAAAFVFAARAGLLTPGEAALRARYELPESQYASVDGQTVHFTDQGEGPAVVLVHGLGYKVESVDPDEETAATRCSCTGRTIRNRLASAAAMLSRFKEEL